MFLHFSTFIEHLVVVRSHTRCRIDSPSLEWAELESEHKQSQILVQQLSWDEGSGQEAAAPGGAAAPETSLPREPGKGSFGQHCPGLGRA